MFNAMFVSFLVNHVNMMPKFGFIALGNMQGIQETGCQQSAYLKNKANIRPGWNVLLKTLFTTRLKRSTYVASDCLSQ